MHPAGEQCCLCHHISEKKKKKKSEFYSYGKEKKEIFDLQNNSVHLHLEGGQLYQSRSIASQPKVLF